MKMAIFCLTCANSKEADKISKALLEKKLVVCSKRFPVSSIYRWKGKINSSKEVMVLYESVEENFDKVEEEVRKLHSYETFVLFSLPVNKTTKSVKDWLKEETN